MVQITAGDNEEARAADARSLWIFSRPTKYSLHIILMRIFRVFFSISLHLKKKVFQFFVLNNASLERALLISNT